MLHDTYSKHHGKIDPILFVPKSIPLIDLKEKKQDFSRVSTHTRAKTMKTFNLLTNKYDHRVSLLPDEFKSLMEISCRAPECPYPFNLDTCESGACYQCIYCFSIYTKSSLYTSWFDNFSWKPRFPSKERLLRTLKENFDTRGVRPFERGKDKKWSGSITNTAALRKAAAQRIPLRIGNRSECFLEKDKTVEIAMEALKFLSDIDYPITINTKSDLLLDPKYFHLLTRFSKIAVQVSLIHLDDKVAKRLEPLAPSASRRVEVIKELNDVGILTMPRQEPIMAFITDDDEHLEEFANSMKDAGVKKILMDSYSYTTRSSGVRQNFLDKGFDFDRMFQGSSEFQSLGSFMIEKAMYYMKRVGIEATTFNFHSIPYNDDPTCCNLGEYFGNWSKYNLFSATYEIVKRGKLSFKEFDEEYYGHELAPEVRNRVKNVWNQKIKDPWCPIWCEGVYASGIDENGDIIYSFDKKRMGELYNNLERTQRRIKK